MTDTLSALRTDTAARSEPRRLRSLIGCRFRDGDGDEVVDINPADPAEVVARGAPVRPGYSTRP